MSKGNDQTYYAKGYDKSISSSHATRGLADSCQYMVPFVKATDKILDVGCGPGSITYALGGLVPQGEVIGVEPTPALLKEAESNRPTTATNNNVKFEEASAFALPYPDESFDIVHAHQVVIHLRDRLEAVKEMKRVLKKGGKGKLCLRDASENVIYPETYDPVLQYSKEKTNGTDTQWGCGVRLKLYALEAGFTEENIVNTSSNWFFSHAEQRQKHAASNIARIQNANFNEGDQYSKEEVIAAWEKWREDPNALRLITNGEIVATTA